MRPLSIAILSLALLGQAPAKAEEIVLFTVDVNLTGTGLSELEVNIHCDLDRPLSLDLSVPVDSTRSFTVPAPAERDMTCLLTTAALPGYQLRFLGDGGSDYDPDSPGCRFSGVKRGHSNFCQIQVENRNTSLTVFKHWIGTSEKEDDVTVSLDCGRGLAHKPLRINADRPDTWTIEVNDADGFRCSVSEADSDRYMGDTGDCENLLILPGAREECTVVNTKVVKMIEVFNRYGLVIMILIFMVVGGIAARRLMP
jgi:hypothetical protein